MKNRSDIEIMACILRSAIGKWEYKTTIMNNAAVSHSQLVRYLAIAVERGLVEYSEVRDLYRITNAGLVFLEKYTHLLSLLPSIPEQSDAPYRDRKQARTKDIGSVVSTSIRK
ncbi:MAG: winged helix-turn-helix domain-containing protein [Thermoproteota archaeon]|jgi:predicted transcriptional regulator|nr:winged helix-turn-helix domain-containing protein [Thermoproteota archaeon]HYY49348.1 winged helix-turn-helix domain-containing protein [Nitrososphaeraceae archaeon]